jgi:uncharacterized protein (DUF2267 family)
MANIQDFGKAVPEAKAWLTDLKQRLKWHDQEKVYLALMATLHALRDSLPQNEAIYLGAQLPVLLRGLYYEGWHPSARIPRAKSRSAFVERIQEGVHRNLGIDAEEGADTVFSFLAERLPGAELEDAKAATPAALRMFWLAGGRTASKVCADGYLCPQCYSRIRPQSRG